ncbi:hypothetical protein [Sphingomonas sp. G-3-2-10]|uniref:hypothetical protein n=1 Tax=Sphingomonas sp. G-3-2-10 TaxID=2728838 RepID=UPI00146DA92D|nr:hypothetical protein [Sphingomonas sp. G-3-2-10]NML06173.1 hypothetical protein [Sphingomonas sp. G-3-2-10]
MIRRKLAVILFAASLLSLPGPALSVTQSEPIYHIYYYDAPNGSVVGIHYSDCTYWGVTTHAWLVGETTEYSEPLLAGYCNQGVWEPL